MIEPGPILALLAEKQQEVMALRQRLQELEQVLTDTVKPREETP